MRHRTAFISARNASVGALSLLLLAAAARAEEPAPAEERPALRPTAGRTVVADTTLVLKAEGLTTEQKTLADLGEDEAANIWAINATRGTYQSYLLYTWPALPTKLFHPGFTITLGPPSKKLLAAQRETARAPQGPPEPAAPR